MMGGANRVLVASAAFQHWARPLLETLNDRVRRNGKKFPTASVGRTAIESIHGQTGLTASYEGEKVFDALYLTVSHQRLRSIVNSDGAKDIETCE